MAPRPTDAEIVILNLLWDHGPATVREVHERLSDKNVGYTTTLKQLQVMQEKGFVDRDDSGRSHIYRALVSREKTQARLLEHLLDTTFGGSTRQLFMRALSHRRTSDADLAEIRSMLDGLPDE